MQWGYKVMFRPWVCNVFSYPLADVVWWFLYMQHAYARHMPIWLNNCVPIYHDIPSCHLFHVFPFVPISSHLFPSLSPWIGPHCCGWWFPDLLETSWWTNHLGGIYLECSVQLQVFAGYCCFFFQKSYPGICIAPCFPDSPVTRTETNPVTNVGKTMS